MCGLRVETNVETRVGVQFHSGSGKNCRWQYYDAGEPQQFFIGKGVIQGESCSEQAFAHLFARHDDSRERQVAPLVSRSEEFKAAASSISLESIIDIASIIRYHDRN